MPYDFRLSPEFIKQETTINSILESRLVPRDLSELETFDDDAVSQAFVYVDDNGTPTKMSVKDILSGALKVVDVEPEEAEEGQIILLNKGNDVYSFEQLINGHWEPLSTTSKAEDIYFIPTETIPTRNIQNAIENLDERVNDIKDGSVKTINGLSGEIDLVGGENIAIRVGDEDITISADGLTTDEESEELELRVKEYTDDAEASAKEHADTLDEFTNQKFDDEVERLDNKVDTLSNDVYHKNVIKPIALTGVASDVDFTPVPESYRCCFWCWFYTCSRISNF